MQQPQLVAPLPSAVRSANMILRGRPEPGSTHVSASELYYINDGRWATFLGIIKYSKVHFVPRSRSTYAVTRPRRRMIIDLVAIFGSTVGSWLAAPCPGIDIPSQIYRQKHFLCSHTGALGAITLHDT